MGKVLKTHERFWAEIAVYGTYLPGGVHRAAGGDRSNFPSHSGLILDLKGLSSHAINHFREMVEPELHHGIAIAVVPSHDPAKTHGGLHALAAALAERGKRIDASGCLVRRQKIDKLAHGGSRDKSVHLNSISVVRPNLIKGRDVLLLDDEIGRAHV